MQLFILQLLLIAAAIIGSTQAAITALPNARELAVDSLLAFPQDTATNSNRKVRALQITPCSISDPKKDECIKTLITNILPPLKEGIPEYGLNSIDPYFYRRGIFRFAADGIEAGLLLKDLEINGLSNIKVNSFMSNITNDDIIIKMNLESKQLKAGGQFKADVKIGGLKLAPKGPFNITIGDFRSTVLTDGKFIRNNGNVRLQLKRLNANLNLGSSKVVSNGILSDPNLNSMILNLVNENLPEITRIGIPATRDQWAPVIIEHINKILAEVPMEKFLIP